jgi:serine/threonine protein phosphatase PrpC
MTQGLDGLHCSSAWLSRSGEDYGVQKYNQDCAFAMGSFNGSIDEALFGVMDGHGPNGTALCQTYELLLEAESCAVVLIASICSNIWYGFRSSRRSAHKEVHA